MAKPYLTYRIGEKMVTRDTDRRREEEEGVTRTASHHTWGY